MTYSVIHEAMYQEMCGELIAHGGLSDSVCGILREILARGDWTEWDRRVVDDLFQIYADQGVIDD